MAKTEQELVRLLVKRNWEIIDEDENIEITITYKIAEVLKEWDLDTRHAELSSGSCYPTYTVWWGKEIGFVGKFDVDESLEEFL